MNQYIIKKEDLIRLECYIGRSNYMVHGWIDNIKAFNKVEEIANGKVKQTNEYYEDGAIIDNESITDLLNGYENENIRLFVQRKDK